jgi:hypothetical protein
MAQSLPLPGTLFHQAIEMFLKARLAEKHTLDELRMLGHRLPKLWKKFKRDLPGADLKRFDDTIVAVARFWRLRYPDAVVTEGALVNTQWEPGDYAGAAGPGIKMPPRYKLVVHDIDHLVAEIFEVCNWNPKSFVRVNDYAKDALTRNNPVGNFLVPEP